MKASWMIAAVLASACSSGSGGGSPSLDGKWEYIDSAGTAGDGVTFNSDGTYVLQVLQLTSSTSGNDEVEKGTFTVSGNTITATPKEWSCPGPDTVSTMTYSFQGSSLALALPSGILILQPNTSPPATNASIVIGCFDSSGNFKPEPLASVTN